MSTATLVGIDHAKHRFHLHGQDKAGQEVFRKKLTRQKMMRFFSNSPTCTIVMEVCADAHFLTASCSLTRMAPDAKWCYLTNRLAFVTGLAGSGF